MNYSLNMKTRKKVNLCLAKSKTSTQETGAASDLRSRKLVGVHDTTCHTRTCAPLLGKDTKPAREQARRDRVDREHGIAGKDPMNGLAAGGTTEATKWSKGSKSDWKSDKDKGSKGNGKGKSKGKSETRYCHDSGEQGHIGANCPYKWANSIDEEDDQTSSCESEPEGENAEELASLETPDEEGEWKKSRVTRW